MAKGVNKQFLLGTVGKDPDIRATASGTTVASFSVAVNDRVKKDGQWVDSTDWFDCVAFQRTAEVVRDYVKKGSQVFIEGKTTKRSWEDKNSGQTRYKSEVLVNELSLLGGRPESGQKAEAPAKTATKPKSDDPFADTYITDDDIPKEFF